MDSEPSPQVKRKHKFAPRAPPRLVPKKEVKTEVIEDAAADANQAKDLLRRFNESAMKARNKVEKKVSASQIAFGYGGESTSLKSYGIGRGGRSVNINQNSASNVVAEKEYTEPWDYYSNYPETLPLRRPYSGNPAKVTSLIPGEQLLRGRLLWVAQLSRDGDQVMASIIL